MMEGLGFAPPEMAADENGQSSEMPPPPPPPSAEQVTSAYSQNSGDDMLSELLDLLQSQENTDTNAYSSVNLTS
jgi:hypothetical protein